jgi:Uma2 family endonuclease
MPPVDVMILADRSQAKGSQMTLLTAPSYTNQFTADELLLMPDQNGYELVNGELRERTVSKESSRIGLQIARLLGNVAAQTGEAEVYGADLGYKCFPPTAEKEIRRADASVIRKERLANLKGDSGYMLIPADLAVEVLSPNDLIRDVNDKVDEYLEAGFGLVWIVDPVRKTVMIRRREGSPGGPIALLHEDQEITAEPALTGFRCKVGELLK